MPNPTYPHYALTGNKLHPIRSSDTAPNRSVPYSETSSDVVLLAGRAMVYYNDFASPTTISNPTTVTSIGSIWTASGEAINLTEGSGGIAFPASQQQRQRMFFWSITLHHNDASPQIVSVNPGVSFSGGTEAGFTQSNALLGTNEKKTLTGVYTHNSLSGAQTWTLGVGIGGGTGDVIISAATLVIVEGTW